MVVFLLVDCQEVATFTVQYKVLEEVQTGTVLGKLDEELGWTENNGTTGTFQLIQDSVKLPVQVDSRDGCLTTVGRLDREQLCQHREPCVFRFSVLAVKYLALIHVDIHVLDINDNAPQFPQRALELEISESASLNTRIPLDRALDLDTGSNAFCTYLLTPSEHFALEVTMSSDGTQQVELVVIKEVDRELCSSFELILTAVDHGEPPKSGKVFVRMTVLDSNDNHPMFAQTSVTLEIRENALPGTVLIRLTATDPDQGPNGEIEYSLSKHASMEVLRTFAIDGRTGHVRLQELLDYEKNPAYEVDVQARDRGANPIPAHCKLLVRVLDVNDNIPDVHIIWAGQAAVVSEGQPKNSFIALVMTSDPDSGSNGQVDCYIKQGAEHFTLRMITPGSYMLLTNAPLDRETWAEHNLTLLVQDQGNPSLAAIRHFTVHVGDVNDNAPCFEVSPYHVAIVENSVPSAALLVLRAHDLDAGLNGKVAYRIPDPAVSEWFEIDADTGEIWAMAPLDAEEMTGFNFLVIAEDAGQPGLSSNVSVKVMVLDVNDNFPVVTKPELEGGWASITVLVDTDTGRVLAPKEESAGLIPSLDAPLLLTISAIDADSGLNGALLYDIVSGNDAGLWVLNPQSGQLYLNSSNASSLVGSEWDLELSVSDQGEVPLSTRVLVKVTFSRHLEHMPDSFPVTQSLSPSAVMGICLVSLLIISLVSLGLIMSLCKREKHSNMAYNCREAEHAYSQQQPRKPPKPIQKADIHVVPVLQRGDTEQPQAKVEAPPETAWVDALGVPCHMTPTLYRTLRNQSTFAEQVDIFAPPALQPRPFHGQRHRNLCAQDMKPRDPKSCAIPWTQGPLSEGASQHQGRPNPERGPQETSSRQHILRSLMRLSLAALAEQGPAGQLARESTPVQVRGGFRPGTS